MRPINWPTLLRTEPRDRRSYTLGIVIACVIAATLVPGLSAADNAALGELYSIGGARLVVAQKNPLTVGYAETVVVNPGNMSITAKIDTGAQTSSLDVLNVRPYVKDGTQWVRFLVKTEDGTRRRFELPVVRLASIKRAGVAPQTRFVVKMGICLGNYYSESEVNLINRKRMKYRMLIGRLYMAGHFVVNPEASFLTRPECGSR